MDKEELISLAFSIIANSGDAKSNLMQALKQAETGDFQSIPEILDSAQKSLVAAHKIQTTMIASEAGGKNLELGIIMIHAQDHLMNTMLLKDIVYNFINLYEKVS